MLYHLRCRTHTEAGKSQIFDPVTLLQCFNNGSVQKGKSNARTLCAIGSGKEEVAT